MQSQCTFVKNNCEVGGNFNFLSFYYCTMGNMGSIARNLVFIPFALFCMMLLMYLLSDTADAYLSPALEHLTNAWGISESLAGVTMLAFGNGAPDIFSGISTAMSSGKPSTNGSPIGENNTAASAI